MKVFDKKMIEIRTYIHRILLDYGAECDVTDSKDYTPLFYAAKTEGIEAAYYLLEHGKADPNFQCTNGKTPMFKATTYEDAMIMMKYGADESITMNPDPETNSDVGKTALEYLNFPTLCILKVKLMICHQNKAVLVKISLNLVWFLNCAVPVLIQGLPTLTYLSIFSLS